MWISGTSNRSEGASSTAIRPGDVGRSTVFSCTELVSVGLVGFPCDSVAFRSVVLSVVRYVETLAVRVFFVVTFFRTFSFVSSLSQFVMDLVGSVLFSVVFAFVGAIHVSIGVVIGVSISISIGFLIVVFVVNGGVVVAVISV